MFGTWELNIGLWGVAVVAVVVGGICSVAKIVADAWKVNRDSERLAVLKQQMLDRGMSSDEIVRVIEAGKPKE
jgi:hypothetical protein